MSKNSKHSLRSFLRHLSIPNILIGLTCLVIAVATVTMSFLLLKGGLPFLGIPSVPGVYISTANNNYFVQKCSEDAKKYSWLDCSKLVIDPAYPNEGYIDGYCSDSWHSGAGVKNDNGEYLWSASIETDPKGDIRSERYGPSHHPDTWGYPGQNPNNKDFDEDAFYMTESPCLSQG